MMVKGTGDIYLGL